MLPKMQNSSENTSTADSIQRKWPDAPEDIFIGADPLATRSLIEKSSDSATEIDLLKSKVLELKKFQKAVNELKQYFTSHNGVPVDKATIKAEDFWRIADNAQAVL